MDFKNISTNLVFTSELGGVDFGVIDIGKELSNALKGKLNDPQIALIANDQLHEIIEGGYFSYNDFKNGYALKNIGILFEPLLKIDFVALCKKYSRDSFFIIEHQGKINEENLYFLTQEAGKKIDIKELNYTVL